VSLRDLFASVGLVSKKDVQRVNRELEKERRVEQGTKRPQAELDREAAEREAAERAALEAAQRAERDEREARREAVERELRVKNLLTANTIRPGSGQPFWHKGYQSKEILRMEVSSGVAYQLRCGEASIAAAAKPGWVDYVILPRKAAQKLLELAPELVVFHVEDTAGISEPDNKFHSRGWETDLTPRRATQDDLRRMTKGE
jgi:uncharacterized protein YaiL (DUF2058 family)